MTDLIKFRWHRGGFDESMNTMTIQKGEDIVKMIFDKTNGHGQEMRCEYQGHDSRESWDDSTFIVTLNYRPVGYSNRSLPTPPSSEFIARLKRAVTIPVYDPQPWYDIVDSVMITFKEFIESAFEYLTVKQNDINEWILYEEAPERVTYVLTVNSSTTKPKAKLTGFIEDTEVVTREQLEDALIQVVENIRKEGSIELCTGS